MKIKHAWSLAAVLILALIIVELLVRIRARNTNLSHGAATSSAGVKHDIGASVPTKSVLSLLAPVRSSSTPIVQTKGQEAKLGLALLNDEQIAFYGRVVDQFNTPVTDATVSASIQVNNGLRVGNDRFTLSTGTDGSFSISGHRGKALGINVKKPGYVLGTTNTRFVYSQMWPKAERHVPDPLSPVLIKMWRLQGAEPLTPIDHWYAFSAVSPPVTLDLLAGKTVPKDGDLRITVNRPPGVVSSQNPQTWSVKIEAIDGGLMETPWEEARITYQAPETGYANSATYTLSTNGPKAWYAGFDEGFLVKSRGGQVYSKVLISFNINQDPDKPMSVGVRGTANTNWSRNWEESQPQ